MLVVTFLDKSINSNDMNMKTIPDTRIQNTMALFRQTLRLATMTRSVPVALYHEKVTTSSVTEFKCTFSGKTLFGSLEWPFLDISHFHR